MENIGIDVKKPERTCNDPKCPFHGNLRIHGQIIVGTVVSTKMNGSIVLKRESRRLIKKYERYETKISKFHAHLPGCIDVRPGDRVKIAECRKLAKTISFVVVEKVN
ncbi:30S ribosomal protein S17 [Picrophilus oshimae]|uniref:Small ribosomal subunit protein uS17 n=2 Tax=Picrophilus torridus (strain ATCC 700027 / DSM 9790 / JCM 10055 / NBRC 100828 / KAW 2/3) TaxID=1122961 RepID=RS17_PICTO|nr:30S ribosomal protein S17 [Picrophilus oshimae]Q6L1B8.1 RecName: Full=Small ribosomal subunit protein uS17; AltName: Full=30S ribosomal protein S17 [Picrophilus oshimae DSM 9789]AAT43234.1 small subunit ribosomal protein S17P [Picrophilus oshimae DSM 9789]SMD30460.1 SSU ribosomal protein S17P [Picrophilus oshimae DSM 9789]